MLYAINKEDKKIHYICPNKQNLDIMLDHTHENITDYLILQEFGMKFVSTITHIDGKCIYNNKEYWSKTAVLNPLTQENYAEHEVLDFLGKPVPYDRYVDEFNNNNNRVRAMDGTIGEVIYNIDVGYEMIALFKEECRLTKFTGITPLEIGVKLADAYSLIMTGSFREAKSIIQGLEPDPFLTAERKQKYIDMLDAADAIEYASDDELIFDTDEQEQADEPSEE
jgi:hypothetical protein